MKLKEITAFLESLVPTENQDKWDNSGFQVGNPEKEVKKVGFALSVSFSVLEQAEREGVDLIIAHHPVTISGIKSVIPTSYPEKLFFYLLEKGIAVYSMHTNLDVSPLGPTAIIAAKLGIESFSPIVENPPYGAVATLPEPVTQRELFDKLSSFLPEDVFRVINYSPDSLVRKVAICSGSGASLMDAVIGNVDVYITGDVKYHDALKAVDCGLTVFDMGHFGTERLFYEKLVSLLAKNFPEVIFILLNEKSPFEVICRC